MAFIARATTSLGTACRRLPQLGASNFVSRCGVHQTRAVPRLQKRALVSATTMSNGTVVERVISHWCGSLDIPRFDTLKSQDELWFGGGKELDDEIRNRFGEDVEMALEGKLDYLIGSEQAPIRSELALVILLDQYPRNMYRGTAKAFAGDAKSREVVMEMLKPERWSTAKKVLPSMIQATFLLPLMHQENVADLDLCFEKVDDLIQDCIDAGHEGDACANRLRDTRKFAGRHRDIILQFGRYPYRNEVLGRESTDEELEYLKDAPRFGQ